MIQEKGTGQNPGVLTYDWTKNGGRSVCPGKLWNDSSRRSEMTIYGVPDAGEYPCLRSAEARIRLCWRGKSLRCHALRGCIVIVNSKKKIGIRHALVQARSDAAIPRFPNAKENLN